MRPEKVISIASRLLMVSLGRTISFSPTYPCRSARRAASTTNNYFSTTTTTSTRRSAAHDDDDDDNSSSIAPQSVSSVLQFYYEKLKDRNVPEPEESIIHLCAKAMDLPWETGYRDLREVLNRKLPNSNNSCPMASSRMVITTEQQGHLDDLMTRRIETLEPIQYLVGQWDFMDHTFWIRPPLLCPRPETEELVEHCCQDLYKLQQQEQQQQHNQQQKPIIIRVLDIGCGTGCIGISIASRILQSSSSSSSSSKVVVEAIDIEQVAVDTSNRNADRVLLNRPSSHEEDQLSRRSEHYSATLSDIAAYQLLDDSTDRFDMVVSNPPYIPRSDMGSLEDTVRAFESDSALCGGTDGLDVIRDIIAKLPSICVTAGATCWLEVDQSHPPLVERLLENNPQVDFVKSEKDLFGNNRFIKLKVNTFNI